MWHFFPFHFFSFVLSAFFSARIKSSQPVFILSGSPISLSLLVIYLSCFTSTWFHLCGFTFIRGLVSSMQSSIFTSQRGCTLYNQQKESIHDTDNHSISSIYPCKYSLYPIYSLDDSLAHFVDLLTEWDFRWKSVSKMAWKHESVVNYFTWHEDM